MRPWSGIKSQGCTRTGVFLLVIFYVPLDNCAMFLPDLNSFKKIASFVLYDASVITVSDIISLSSKTVLILLWNLIETNEI